MFDRKGLLLLILTVVLGAVFGFLWNKYVLLSIMAWAVANPDMWVIIATVLCSILAGIIFAAFKRLEWVWLWMPLKTISRW